MARRDGWERFRERGREFTNRTRLRRAIFNYLWPLSFGFAPWLQLYGLVENVSRATQHRLIVEGAILAALALGLVVFYIFDPGIRHMPGLIVCAVLGAVFFLEGVFAVLYFIWSHTSNTAFSAVMSKPDAAYFTISTATATGMGDIHPVSGGARLWVTGQMVASVFLIVLALGIAFSRLAGRDS